MLKELSEFAPIGFIAGIILYVLLHFGLISESVAGRVAKADYMPQCKTQFASAVRTELDARFAQMDQPTEAERTGPAAGAVLRQMGSQYPEHLELLNQLSGGMFSGVERAQEKAAEQARRARANAKEVLRQQAEATIASAPDVCTCQARAAYHDGARVDWTIYTATLGRIEPGGVENFGALIASQAATCRKG